jgi:hypothetical protein
VKWVLAFILVLHSGDMVPVDLALVRSLWGIDVQPLHPDHGRCIEHAHLLMREGRRRLAAIEINAGAIMPVRSTHAWCYPHE